MIITFPFAFDGRETQEHIAMGELFVRRNRILRPRDVIIQMADSITVEIDGVDDCIRTDNDELGQWHFKAMREFPHDQFLRVDYDVLVLSDVSHVFDAEFDIAIAKERKAMMNNGVVFVKNKEFFAEADANYRAYTSKDSWQDIQIAMQMTIDSGKYRVQKLDSREYNYIYTPGDGMSRARIVHFKGWRKQHMAEFQIPMKDAA